MNNAIQEVTDSMEQQIAFSNETKKQMAAAEKQIHETTQKQTAEIRQLIEGVSSASTIRKIRRLW